MSARPGTGPKGVQPKMIQADWTPEMVAEFNKRWQEFWAWVEERGVPVPLQEAALRDALSGIEHRRTAGALQAYIPILRGAPQ